MSGDEGHRPSFDGDGPRLVGADREIAIDPVFLSFDDGALEGQFRRKYHTRMASVARRAIPAGAPGYVLMVVILDEPVARFTSLAMVAILAVWIALQWTDVNARHYTAVTVGFEAAVSALSMVIILALPAPSAVVIAIAFITLNFMWISVLLRPLFRWASALGATYLAAVVVAGAFVWDQYGGGEAPDGFISVFAGHRGGALLVFLYGGFLLALTLSVAYRLERADRVDFLLRRRLDTAYARSEQLLTNVLPVPVAERLKQGENPIADDLAEVTVVFADIVGFTELSASVDPGALVAFLNHVFTRFDALAARHGLEKIKTVGDAYMAVAGAPQPMADHADAAATMALDMIRVVRDLRLPDGAPLQLRVGIGSGPAVAGVIGASKFIYDVWGDTVNTASRMESHGVPGRVQLEETTRRLLGDRFHLEPRGTVEVKGKGSMRTWLLRDPSPS